MTTAIAHSHPERPPETVGSPCSESLSRALETPRDWRDEPQPWAPPAVVAPELRHEANMRLGYLDRQLSQRVTQKVAKAWLIGLVKELHVSYLGSVFSWRNGAASCRSRSRPCPRLKVNHGKMPWHAQIAYCETSPKPGDSAMQLSTRSVSLFSEADKN